MLYHHVGGDVEAVKIEQEEDEKEEDVITKVHTEFLPQYSILFYFILFYSTLLYSINYYDRFPILLVFF